MLHLLPIRAILQLAAALIAIAVLAAVDGGWIGTDDAAHDSALLLRWSSAGSVLLIVALFAAWRWVPPAQRFIFPYLGGRWSGTLKFNGKDGDERRTITLEVKHTLFGLKLLLDSKESTSRTLVVQAERDKDFDRYRLYYVYLNERKAGVPGGGERYRGLAVLRVEPGSPSRLYGDYFTETHRRGTLELTAKQLHPWWKLWR